HDGHLELLAGRAHADLSDVYRWNGNEFVCADSQFPAYYSEAQGPILAALNSQEPLLLNERSLKALEAMEIYLYENRADDAIAVGRKALKDLDDPVLTKPNYQLTGGESSDQIQRLQKGFESDKAWEKAYLYYALAIAMRTQGKQRESIEAFRISTN